MGKPGCLAMSRGRPIRKLEPEQKEIFEMAFSMFDRDGSGTVDVEEMRAVCKQVGIIPTDSELQLMIQELDTDQSGDIDKEEFLACLESKQVDPESEDVIKFAFERFDTDGSGKLSHAELEDVLTHMGEPLTAREIKQLISICDKNNDGEVDIQEFMAVVLDKP